MSQESKPADSFVTRKAALVATGFAVACIVIPFWFWIDTWFGRTLSDEKIGQYLTDTEYPRKIQHALVQISERMSTEGEAARVWYPEILKLVDNELPEIRLTLAWLMGDDSSSEEFHDALRVLVADPHPMVRRNAALALAKFGDTTGLQEIRAMLQTYRLASEHAGIVNNRLEVGDSFDSDALLVRIQPDGGGEPFDVRAPLPGIVEKQMHADGVRISSGDEVTLIRPESMHVMQALLGLYLVGTPGEIDLIRPFLRPREGLSSNVMQQAALTLEQIRKRQAGQEVPAGSAGGSI